MLAGLGDYGSGSESEGEHESKGPSVSVKPSPNVLVKKPSALSLPPPSAQKPQAKARRPKKITIGLPALPSTAQDDDDTDDLKNDKPPAKKARLESGAGSSSLLSMLPAPKQKQPVVTQERVLGGGRGPGLVFNTTPSTSIVASASNEVATVQDETEETISNVNQPEDPGDSTTKAPSNSFSFLPTSVAKRKPNVSVEEGPRPNVTPHVAPTKDFFGLGASSSSSSKSLAVPTSVKPSSISISSAPEIAEFKPPPPTREDPYPGYYLLPSGAWAAYDPEYYNAFLKKWQREYDDHVRALEKGTIKGFEGSEETAEEVNAMKEMEKARREIQEREAKKAVTKDAKGEPAKPRMNIDPTKLSGRAKSRHQLSSLLTEAYQNREALEDKIAEGRRNRKEAGNKYGF